MAATVHYVLNRRSPEKDYISAVSSKSHWVVKQVREAYLEASIEQSVAWQIKLNRERRNLTQAQLAKLLNTQQSAISRLEDPLYGSYNVETLLNVANAFDCALSIKFVSFSELAFDSQGLSEEAQYAAPFELEMEIFSGKEQGGSVNVSK